VHPGPWSVVRCLLQPVFPSFVFLMFRQHHANNVFYNRIICTNKCTKTVFFTVLFIITIIVIITGILIIKKTGKNCLSAFVGTNNSVIKRCTMNIK
jgi:thiosulfate reductase cytochrome b subunit